MLAHGVPVAASSAGQHISLQCTWTNGQADTHALSVSAESTDTKAENTVGHFVSPTTGPIHVDCASWGAMFIPDADNHSADVAGWVLLAAIITLTVGGALAMSELRIAFDRSRTSAPRDDDEVEGLVDVTAAHDEVVRGDGDDVAG